MSRGQILNPSIDYHRNGVAGGGFHLVTFKIRDGRGRRAMIAYVFDTSGQVAVICPSDPSLRWRGDYYETELRALIAGHYAAIDEARLAAVSETTQTPEPELENFDMGNRAVITTAPYSENNIGIYVHWNGGRESIEGFLRACKRLEYRAPGSDTSYGLARLCQAIGLYFGGSTSVGIDVCKNLDTDNGNNGVWTIDGWEIVGRTDGNVDEEKTASICETIIAKTIAADLAGEPQD